MRKRKRGTGTVTRQDGRYVARGPSPQRKPLGRFDRERDAQRACDEYMATLNEQSRETVGEFSERWVELYPRPKASTNRTRHYGAKAIRESKATVAYGGRAARFANVPMRDVDRSMARAYAVEYPSRLPTLRSIFYDALEDRLIDSNPFANLRLKKSRGRKDIKTLTEAEVLALADLALEVFDDRMGPRIRAIILVAADSLRPGEIFKLERADFSIRRKRYAICHEPKTGDRAAVMSILAAGALQALELPERGVVFRTPRERPFTKTSWIYYWHKLRAAFEARLPERRRLELAAARGGGSMHFYELRHAAATILIERGVSREDVAVQLHGHSNPGVVNEVYGHPSLEDAWQRIEQAERGKVREIHREREADTG